MRGQFPARHPSIATDPPPSPLVLAKGLIVSSIGALEARASVNNLYEGDMRDAILNEAMRQQKGARNAVDRALLSTVLENEWPHLPDDHPVSVYAARSGGFMVIRTSKASGTVVVCPTGEALQQGEL